jgi:hypothetical protein
VGRAPEKTRPFMFAPRKMLMAQVYHEKRETQV